MNCTKLPDIANDRTDVSRDTWDQSIQYLTTVKHECNTFGQEFRYNNRTFYPHIELECQADGEWSPSSIPDDCECKLPNLPLLTIIKLLSREELS